MTRWQDLRGRSRNAVIALACTVASCRRAAGDPCPSKAGCHPARARQFSSMIGGNHLTLDERQGRVRRWAALDEKVSRVLSADRRVATCQGRIVSAAMTSSALPPALAAAVDELRDAQRALVEALASPVTERT